MRLSVHTVLQLLCCLTLALASGRAVQAEAVHERVAQIRAQREALDATVWADEMEAQRHESVFVTLWDNLRASTNALAVLAGFPFETIALGAPEGVEPMDHGITRTPFSAPRQTLTHSEWVERLYRFAEQGHRLIQSEWHHEAFEPRAEGGPRSRVRFLWHVQQTKTLGRKTIRGELEIRWAQTEPNAVPIPKHIRVRHLEMYARDEPPAFMHWRSFPQSLAGPTRALENAQPHVNLYDLDGDGLSEIVLCHLNRVLWNRGHGRFEVDRLCAKGDVEAVPAGLIADFTGDGVADYLCAVMHDVPYLFEGRADGRYPGPGTPIPLDAPLAFPSAVSAGDINGDGRLDLWLGQYKSPYKNGQVPTPYYAANDGYPFYLLLNLGNGRFRDVTESAISDVKRFRRVYSGSLVDLDEDGDLDLFVVSDFAGVDLYENDGSGRFQDATSSRIDTPHNFGMAHTFADFNRDGRLDAYVIGMSSTTARRLENMGLAPPIRTEHNRMRVPMSYGNRMYLGGPAAFTEPAFGDVVARTGWSWGTRAFDFDNDGDEDIYVANGHISGRSSRDYCTTFWRHDIYESTPQPDPALAAFFRQTVDRRLYHEISWNGYEHNVLFLNRNGKSFVNIAYLMGVAFEFDSRGVLADDLDGDGRLDLLVSQKHYGHGETLHLFRNVMRTGNRWIGVRLREEGGGLSPLGAKVTVETDRRGKSKHIVTGDSFSAQHAPTVHFGLGRRENVLALEVTWLNGPTRRVESPAPNRYHAIHPPN